MNIIHAIESEYLRKNQDLMVGETVNVYQKIREGEKSRIQKFSGIIIKIQNGGTNKTFTVRKKAHKVGVEKTFLINSPTIQNIEVIKKNKVRKAKLLYLRKK